MKNHLRFAYYLLAVGVLATLTMDLTALTAVQCGFFELGRQRIGPSLLGRWIGSMAAGHFVHSSILETPPVPHEIGLGVVAHYVIGVTLSSFFVGLHRHVTGRPAGLVSALAYGCATCVLPWFLMFPAMGFGVLGLNVPQESMLTTFSGFNHVSFGLWIYVWSNLLRRVLAETEPELASAGSASPLPRAANSTTPDEQREFWSKVARKYDRVVDLQIGPLTRSMVRDRVSKEVRLGHLAEFGCGTGYYTSILAGRAVSVAATDFSPGMLALAMQRNNAANVTFHEQDCQKTTFADAAFDTAVLSLVLHFTEPRKTLAEMHRILKPGGLLIIANPAMGALTGLDRFRSRARVFFYGITRYRIKPPKGFVKALLTDRQLGDLLETSGFKILSEERIVDPSRSSNIPVQYIRAVSSKAPAPPSPR